METNHEDRWVAGQFATLNPQWQPDFAHGRQLLDAGLNKRTRSWLWMAATAAAAAAAVCLAVLAVPQTRAYAQQLWNRVVLNRIDVVRLDLSDLPLQAHMTMNGSQQKVQDLDEAERTAGFRPYLPAGVLQTAPALSTVGLMNLEQTIHVHDLEAALRKVGASDVQVPPEWEGVQLHAEIGPMVVADYGDDVQVLQAPPIGLSVPTGFPLEHFAEVAFRSLGVSVWEARALAQKFVANPGWLLDIPPDEPVNIQEVQLHTGRALLVEDFGDDGKVQRVTVMRSTAGRIYAVMANSRQMALKVADALP
ncbi:hypothetical protein SBA3_1580018 [Candidatus Sulfopaludibacter sp. SbA3]|nr:hypothetical protein SBA3_1580018 [Candidatus Sulfopaludibacter sp. SbA3]